MSHSIIALIALVPWPIVIGWLLAVAIPYLSALVTDHPGHFTGIVTVVLSLVDGILSALAQQGDHIDVRAALAAGFGAWVIATKWHSKVLSGTQVERDLHAVGGPSTPPT